MNTLGNTLEDLLSPEQLKEYLSKEYPYNTNYLGKILLKKLKEDPEYEVWVPLFYCKYVLRRTDPTSPSLIKSPFAFISNKGGLARYRDGKYFTISTYIAHGYPRASFHLGFKKIEPFMLHRALATVFIPLKSSLKLYHPKDLQVNHKNGIKTDYSLTNLEWSTPSENFDHAVKMGWVPYRKGLEHSSTKSVKATVLFGEHKGKVFLLHGNAEYISYGLTQGSISMCCSGRSKTYSNCSWSFATSRDLIELGSPDPEILKEALAHKEVPDFMVKAVNLETGESLLIKGNSKGFRKFGFLPGCVWSVLYGRAKSHKGFSFTKIYPFQRLENPPIGLSRS